MSSPSGIYASQRKRLQSCCRLEASRDSETPAALPAVYPTVEEEEEEINYQEEEEISPEEFEAFLKEKLPSHPNVYRGSLENGLQFVILPNMVPPNRWAEKDVFSKSK